MSKKQSVKEVHRDLLNRIQTEGVQAAYEASLAVCRNPKAPAPARATASATIFRVAGYFDPQERTPEKQAHEMNGEELAEAIGELERSLRKADDPGVFD